MNLLEFPQWAQMAMAVFEGFRRLNVPQNKQKCLELWLEQTATNFDFVGFCIMAHKKGVVDLNAMFSKGVQ